MQMVAVGLESKDVLVEALLIVSCPWWRRVIYEGEHLRTVVGPGCFNICGIAFADWVEISGSN
ncbi:hypothetical protein Ancab_023945 [Ancistrocladus abbreviatus]